VVTESGGRERGETSSSIAVDVGHALTSHVDGSLDEKSRMTMRVFNEMDGFDDSWKRKWVIRTSSLVEGRYLYLGTIAQSVNNNAL
jgi:hypothetical protein